MGEPQIGETQTFVRENIIPLFNKHASPDPPWKGKTKAKALEEGFGKLQRKLARAALKYLETKGLHYELESTMLTGSFHDFVIRKGVIHGNFTAIKKSDKSSGESPCAEMFFAEAYYKKDGFGVDVNCCSTVDPAAKGGRCETCSLNDYEIIHPVDRNTFSSGPDLEPGESVSE